MISIKATQLFQSYRVARIGCYLLTDQSMQVYLQIQCMAKERVHLTSLSHGLIQVKSGLALIWIQPRLSIYMVHSMSSYKSGLLIRCLGYATTQRKPQPERNGCEWPEAARSSCCQQHCSFSFATLHDGI